MEKRVEEREAAKATFSFIFLLAKSGKTIRSSSFQVDRHFPASFLSFFFRMQKTEKERKYEMKVAPFSCFSSLFLFSAGWQNFAALLNCKLSLFSSVGALLKPVYAHVMKSLFGRRPAADSHFSHASRRRLFSATMGTSSASQLLLIIYIPAWP